MPTARYSLTSSVVNDIIYVIGGYNGSYLSTNEAYNPFLQLPYLFSKIDFANDLFIIYNIEEQKDTYGFIKSITTNYYASFTFSDKVDYLKEKLTPYTYHKFL